MPYCHCCLLYDMVVFDLFVDMFQTGLAPALLPYSSPSSATTGLQAIRLLAYRCGVLAAASLAAVSALLPSHGSATDPLRCVPRSNALYLAKIREVLFLEKIYFRNAVSKNNSPPHLGVSVRPMSHSPRAVLNGRTLST